MAFRLCFLKLQSRAMMKTNKKNENLNFIDCFRNNEHIRRKFKQIKKKSYMPFFELFLSCLDAKQCQVYIETNN